MPVSAGGGVWSMLSAQYSVCDRQRRGKDENGTWQVKVACGIMSTYMGRLLVSAAKLHFTECRRGGAGMSNLESRA